MKKIHMHKKINIKITDYIIIITIIIILITFILLKRFTQKSNTLLLNYSERKTTNIITKIINDSVSECISNNQNINIITLDNKILNVNDKLANEISLNISNNIIEKINEFENSQNIYFVPYGLVYNISSFTNIGPQIPFKIQIIGSINSEIKNNIVEYGINNSLIEIKFDILIQYQIILPFISKIVDINKTILLDSKVVQGSVPNYYGNFNVK